MKIYLTDNWQHFSRIGDGDASGDKSFHMSNSNGINMLYMNGTNAKLEDNGTYVFSITSKGQNGDLLITNIPAQGLS